MHISYQPVPTLNPTQLRRLRALPHHPVHALAMQSLSAHFNSMHHGQASQGALRYIAQLVEPGRELLLGGRDLDLHGYVMWRRVDSWLDDPGPHVKLDYLFVRREHQGHGSRLLQWLETHEDADMTVMSTHHARCFYARHGYQLDHAHCLRMTKRR